MSSIIQRNLNSGTCNLTREELNSIFIKFPELSTGKGSTTGVITCVYKVCKYLTVRVAPSEYNKYSAKLFQVYTYLRKNKKFEIFAKLCKYEPLVGGIQLATFGAPDEWPRPRTRPDFLEFSCAQYHYIAAIMYNYFDDIINHKLYYKKCCDIICKQCPNQGTTLICIYGAAVANFYLPIMIAAVKLGDISIAPYIVIDNMQRWLYTGGYNHLKKTLPAAVKFLRQFIVSAATDSVLIKLIIEETINEDELIEFTKYNHDIEILKIIGGRLISEHYQKRVSALIELNKRI